MGNISGTADTALQLGWVIFLFPARDRWGTTKWCTDVTERFDLGSADVISVWGYIIRKPHENSELRQVILEVLWEVSSGKKLNGVCLFVCTRLSCVHTVETTEAQNYLQGR